jgi:hypothetical protein
MFMLTRWWTNFCDLARYGDSHPSEFMIGIYHTLFTPFLLDDYKHLDRWMLVFIIVLGLIQSYYAIVGNLLQRHVINVAVAFASVAFVINTAYHGSLDEAHCLVLTTCVALWNVYRTNYEVDKKVK